MANPMVMLNSFQDALNAGMQIHSHELIHGYKMYYDEPFKGGRRYTFAKVENGKVLVIAVFGLEYPIDNTTCYNVGYAVSENCRGKRLSIEAVNLGIERLKTELAKNNIKRFYIEAVISENNIPSIKVAEKLFSSKGTIIKERETGENAFHFKKLYST